MFEPSSVDCNLLIVCQVILFNEASAPGYIVTDTFPPTGIRFIQCEPLIPIWGYRYEWLTLYETNAYRDIGMSGSHCMKLMPIGI